MTILAILASLTLAGCRGGDDPTPAPATPTASATIDVTPLPTPAFTQASAGGTAAGTAEPPLEIAAAVWLIDIETREVLTLTEDLDTRPLGAGFEDGVPVVRYAFAGEPPDLVFNLAGKLVTKHVRPPPCVRVTDATIQVEGRSIAAAVGEVECGLVSPTGRWMTYERDVRTQLLGGAERIQSWDQWLVDLDTGKTSLLRAELRHCGGCDGVFGASWSPGGRYLYFAELVGDGDVFLADAATGSVRRISTAAGGILARPAWAPASDWLLYPGPGGGTVFDNLETDTRTSLSDLPWPAAFEASERYLYGTANPPGSTIHTAIFEVATLTEVARLPGRPIGGTLYGAPGTPVQAVGGTSGLGGLGGVAAGFIAALENATGCAGTMLYTADGTRTSCVGRGTGAVFSPAGTTVAIAVRTDQIADTTGAGFGGNAFRFDILLIDLATNEAVTLASDAVSRDAPAIEWNEDGTHILVRWPTAYGL